MLNLGESLFKHRESEQVKGADALQEQRLDPKGAWLEVALPIRCSQTIQSPVKRRELNDLLEQARNVETPYRSSLEGSPLQSRRSRCGIENLEKADAGR